MTRPLPVAVTVLLAGGFLAGCVEKASLPDPDDALEEVDARLALLHGLDVENTTLDAAAVGLLRSTVGTYYSVGFSTFEPTLGVTSKGNLFMTNIRRELESNLDQGTHVLRSTDQGRTWTDMGPFDPTGERAQFPNSNDPYIHVDPITDRIIKFDMHELTCMTLEYSDDEGETWTPPTPACGQPPAVQDHQSIVTARPRQPAPPMLAYENVLVYCVARALQGGAVGGGFCSTSFDGGATWTPLAPGFEPGRACYGLHGHLVADAEGRVYRPGLGCDAKPTVWRSEDNGFTWTEHVVSTEDMLVDIHDVGLGVDAAGNLHAFWIGKDGLGYYAYSKDHGGKWSEATVATHPDVTAAGKPTLEAGADGRVALAYIGTTVAKGYKASDDREWHGYIGVSVNAMAPDAVFATVAVDNVTSEMLSPDLGDAHACGRDRCGAFGDFIDIVIDPSGRPYAAFGKNREDATPGGNDEAAVIGTIATGPALRGELKALEPLPLGATLELE